MHAHAIDASVGMPPPDPDAPVDGMDLIEWSTGDADLILFHGENVAHRLETDAADALRLAEVLHERGPCTLAAVLAGLESKEC
jgi:hypothetical protein